jgi:hypothetical protein
MSQRYPSASGIGLFLVRPLHRTIDSSLSLRLQVSVHIKRLGDMALLLTPVQLVMEAHCFQPASRRERTLDEDAHHCRAVGLATTSLTCGPQIADGQRSSIFKVRGPRSGNLEK